jgi:fucose permease
MNLLHAFYGIGAIAGPIFAGYITGKAGFNWRVPYLWSLPLCAGLFIAAIFTKFPENKNMADNARDEVPGKSFFDALKNPHVWLISVTIGLGVTVEAISPNWGLLYFQDIFGIDPRIRGAALLSGFFICFAVSRLLCSILVEKIDYMNFLTFAAFSIVATYTAIYLLGANGIFLLPVLGLFIGPLWPTTMAVSIRHFGKDAPIMTSAIISLGSAVNAGVQYLIGLTNRLFGAAWGYRSGLLYSLVYILLLVILKKTIKTSRTKDAKVQTAIEN